MATTIIINPENGNNNYCTVHNGHDRTRQIKLFPRKQERIMKKGKGRGKEREAPTHLIKVSKRSHAGRVTKNKNGCGTWCHDRMMAFAIDRRARRHDNNGRETRGSRSLYIIRN